MTVVSDTTPIIALSSIGKLDLLHELFGEIIKNRFVRIVILLIKV